MLRCTDDDRVFYRSSPRNKAKKLAKKKRHLVNNVSGKRKHISRFPTIISQNSVVTRLDFSLRSMQRKLIHSFWNYEVWLDGLPDLIFFFLHRLFRLPQNFHCDPTLLPFSVLLFKYIIKHYVHSFKYCKANLAFYCSPYMSWQARWEPLPLLPIPPKLPNTQFKLYQLHHCITTWKVALSMCDPAVRCVPMALLCSIFSSLSDCGCPNSTCPLCLLQYIHSSW